MKQLGVILFLALVIVVLAGSFVFFQVRETESVLVTRFGDPVRTISEPGLHWKFPPPIEKMIKFDARMRVFEAVRLEETPTKGVIPIILNTYVVWRVSDPLLFYKSVGTVKEAQNYLRGQLSDTQNNIVGQYAFSDFINSDVEKIKIEEIQQKMLDSLRAAIADDYGIWIEGLGIKQLKISKDVSQDVFARMQAERNRYAEETIAEGRATATKIKSDADSKSKELLAAAQARAKAIRGQGDAEAAQYYQMLEADPELAMFLRDLETLKKSLESRSTIVISAETEPFKLLKEMPKLEPKQPEIAPQAKEGKTVR